MHDNVYHMPPPPPASAAAAVTSQVMSAVSRQQQQQQQQQQRHDREPAVSSSAIASGQALKIFLYKKLCASFSSQILMQVLVQTRVKY